MLKILSALAAALGFTTGAKLEATDTPPPVASARPSKGLYVPRGCFPVRRSYMLPPGNWTTPRSYGLARSRRRLRASQGVDGVRPAIELEIMHRAGLKRRRRAGLWLLATAGGVL